MLMSVPRTGSCFLDPVFFLKVMSVCCEGGVTSDKFDWSDMMAGLSICRPAHTVHVVSDSFKSTVCFKYILIVDNGKRERIVKERLITMVQSAFTELCRV